MTVADQWGEVPLLTAAEWQVLRARAEAAHADARALERALRRDEEDATELDEAIVAILRDMLSRPPDR